MNGFVLRLRVDVEGEPDGPMSVVHCLRVMPGVCDCAAAQASRT